MALTKVIATKYAERQGDKLVGDGTKFTGSMRSFDFEGFREGDVFTIPTTFEVYEQKFGKKPDGSEITSQYIFVETSTGEIKKFFPSMFSRVIILYENTKADEPLKIVRDSEGKVITFHVLGTATSVFRAFEPNVDAGMRALAGKKLKITKATPICTKSFNRNAIITRSQFTIDIIE